MTTSSLVQPVGTVDADERRGALAAAVEAGGEVAVLSLARALGDEDWRVRKEAITYVRDVDADALLPHLVGAIVQSENVGLRNAAIEACASLGDRAVPVLVREFDRGTQTARRFLVSALGMTGSLDASDALVRACSDHDENLIAAAIDALARVGGPKAEAEVRRQLAQPDSFRRMAALDALDRLSVSVPFEEIEPVVADPVVRRAALGVLGRCRSVFAVPLLFDGLSDRSPSVLASSAVALEQLSEATDEIAQRIAEEAIALRDGARTGLRRLLGHGDVNARRAAAFLLLSARDSESLSPVLELAAESALSSASLSAFAAWGPPAIPALLEVWARARGPVRALALELAADLSAQPGVPVDLSTRAREAVRQDVLANDEGVREAAIRSLCACATVDDLPTLVRLASTPRMEDALRAAATIERFVDSDREAVERATELVEASAGGGALCPVLARLGSEKAIERIETCLSSDDARARRAAIVALAEVLGARAVESLAFALADEDVDVRATAAMMLGRMRDDEGHPVGAGRLVHAVEHESPVVQLEAMKALVDLGDARVREPMVRLVDSPHAEVAASALSGLRELGDERATELALRAFARPEAELVVAALRVLGDRPLPREARDAVVASIEHDAWEIRLAAVPVVAGLPDGSTLLARRLARENEPMVRRAIDEVLSSEGA